MIRPPWTKTLQTVYFISYAEALDQILPLVKEAGAELLICIGHICYSEMRDLVPKAKELGISVITGGHCNEFVAEILDANPRVIK